MSDLLVVGAGGHARVVLDVLTALGQAASLVLDDDEKRWGTLLHGVTVSGPIVRLQELRPGGVTAAFVALGDNARRRDLDAWVRAEGLRVPSIIHPSASVSATAVIESGALICAGAIVGPGSRVGKGAIVNTGAQVDHDCVVGEFAHLAPASVLCGGVRVGALSFVGARAAVAPGLTLGARSVAGLGAAVIRDVPDGTTVVGVPARPMASVHLIKSRNRT